MTLQTDAIPYTPGQKLTPDQLDRLFPPERRQRFVRELAALPDTRHQRIADALGRIGHRVELVTVGSRHLQRGIVRAQAVSHAA